MKKLTPRFKEWLRRRARRQSRHWSQRSSQYAELSTNTGRRLVRVSRGWSIPESLCVVNEQDETFAFFHDLRIRTVRKMNGVVRVPSSRNRGSIGNVRSFTDFTQLRRITPGAALILAAEYDRMRRMSGRPASVLDIDKWDDDVFSQLLQLGFFRLLGLEEHALKRNMSLVPTEPRLLIAPMQCGDNADYSEAHSALETLFDHVGGDQALRVQLRGAVVDAIENVRGHAYPHPLPNMRSLIPPLWRVSGSAEKEGKRLTLAIYDQGQTIPVTLPFTWQKSDVASIFRKLFGLNYDPESNDHDGEALHAALQLSMTSTNRPERGKGLSKIRDVVSQCPGGRLTLISRRGYYNLISGCESRATMAIPLLGTFVEIEASFRDSRSQDG